MCRKYRKIGLLSFLYIFTLTVPHSTAVQLVYPKNNAKNGVQAVLCCAVPCRAVLCQLNSVHDNQHCLYCVFATWICKQSEVFAYTESNLSMLKVAAAVCTHCAWLRFMTHE